MLYFRICDCLCVQFSYVMSCLGIERERGKFLGSEVVASAILDRLFHHGFVFNVRGESYRLKEKRRAGLLPSAQIPSSKVSDPYPESESPNAGHFRSS